MLKRFSPFLALLSLTIIWATPGAAEDAPKLLGQHKDWSAYTYGSGDSKICYVLSEPKEMLPRNATRGDVYLMVTHRPAKKVTNEISMRVGYQFSDKSNPYAEIGSDQFQMFTGVSQGGEQAFWAWLVNQSDEARMVRAMRGGSSMIIKGTSERGTLTTDRYSLSGVSAALDQIDKACK